MNPKDAELLKACESGDTGLALLALKKSLLSKSASVNAWIDDDWRTPLHVATRKGFKEIVHILLSNGADANASAKNGETPLSLAISEGFTEIAGLLLDQGADVHARDEFENTPLHHAVRAFVEENIALVGLLVGKGADLNAVNTSGETPLYLAAEYGRNDSALFLVEKGADVHIENAYGNTPLLIAAENGEQEIVQILKARGARGRTLKNKFSAFSFSCKEELEMIVRLLHASLDANVFIREIEKSGFAFEEESPMVGAMYGSKHAVLIFSANKDHRIFSCAYAQMGGDFNMNITLVESTGGGNGRLLDDSLYDE